MPRDLPILFQGRLVRAILRELNPKTQTRRILTIRDKDIICPDCLVPGDRAAAWVDPECIGGGPCLKVPCKCNGTWQRIYPRWSVGDSLYVREAHAICCTVGDEVPPLPVATHPVNWIKPWGDLPGGWEQAYYRATDPVPELACEHKSCDGGAPCRRPWRPSIHMPRWASRIDLEITQVRIERLQDITEEDAEAEGVDLSRPNIPGGTYTDDFPSARRVFSKLWDSINAERGFGLESNPWVVVLSFKRIRP